ncbi:MAG: hypothetical protein DMG97_37150 [Acidobacteria bacterium]|nr:MAG: hypothetical protein DMG98_22690 [Acidobacteriota bacterium]PYV63643.1 MAG: hypothetical protein DMG97_37150 [Acidobacteriota bacterium]PYV73730.1 MAG: hypothetical protein DMG96_22240 [Acidobacteriota bacterium]
MVWPIKPDGVAIGENVRSEAHEGQPQRYRFMNGLLQSRVLRSEMDMRERARVATAEAQYPGIFPTRTPGRVAAMPHPTWREWYNAALVEFDLAKLPERVEVACQAIHQHRIQKGHTLTAEDRKELDDALRVLFTLMQRAA